MEFVHTRQALEKIVETVGTVYIEQLEMFFRNAEDAGNVRYYIKELIALRIFDYDKERNLVRWHTGPKLKDEIVRRRLMAFWLIAYYDESNIREVIPLAYPSQFYFIMQDNTSYDVTVCLSETEAKTAFRVRNLYQCKAEDDDVNHIVIVRTHEVGKAVMAEPSTDFDSYCILDDNKMPMFFQPDSNEPESDV